MFATLDLQLKPIDFSDDLANAAPLDANGRGADGDYFANILRDRVGTAPGNVTIDGEFLPPDGNSLPLTVEPLQVSLLVNPVAAETGTTTTDLPDIAGRASTESDDRDIGLRREALLDGQRILPDRGAVSIGAIGFAGQDGSRTSDSSMSDKGLPRVFVPPTAEPPGKKSVPREFVPPTAAHRVEIPTTVSEQIPLINPHQATPVGIDLSAMRRAPRVIAPTPANNIDTVKYDPAPPVAVSGTRIEADAIREVARLSPSRLHQVQGSGHGQVGAPPVSATPSIAAPGSPAFAAAMELAADQINTPVRESQWADRIGERLVMLAGGQQRTAEIRLTPAELGPLRVQISIDDGATNVAFQAHHAITRDALEQALPRLRELLEENGMTLGDASVGEQDVNEHGGEARDDAENSTANGGAKDAMDDDHNRVRHPLQAVADGLVDTFA